MNLSFSVHRKLHSNVLASDLYLYAQKKTSWMNSKACMRKREGNLHIFFMLYEAMINCTNTYMLYEVQYPSLDA